MKLLFHLGHPAHFQLLKKIISKLETKGHSIHILIKKKDILEDLLKRSNLSYTNILPSGRSDSKIGIFWGMIKADLKLFLYCLKNKPDILIGTSFAISHVGKILHIASINLNEDDAAVVPFYAKLSYPWASAILTPIVCNNGKWESKSIKYNSYHELAYLHPNHFTPDKSIVKQYFSPEEKYFIIRFAKLKAHHDSGVSGINTTIARKLIELLNPYGEIYITSERTLEAEFEPYRININPLDIHHVLAFASIYIGDSQTMAAEAGVLGTPFIRFNDFVGRISYLAELEDKYNLGVGIKPNEPELLFEKVKELISTPNLSQEFQIRRQKMLSKKIDYAAFLVWFIENYPESSKIMKDNPDYQYKFK